MEAWTLYNAVSVVNSHAGTVKLSVQQTADLIKDLTNGRPVLMFTYR